MPPTIQFSNDLISTAIANGTMTPALAPLAFAALGAIAWVKDDPHFQLVAGDPGHWDTSVDDECLERIQRINVETDKPLWTQADIDHMNEWPADQKEAFRVRFCNDIVAEKPLMLRWMARRKIRRAKLVEQEDGGLLFVQPAANPCGK